ncbi:MAG: hypothetical protein PF518_11580 [Spirochaetaceae bacterium]|jgi:hypothetical protein|nr:hypothetical protein [Spirochaetaceae bacterium]
MEDFLEFTGPVKLLIIERTLLKGKGLSKKEGLREILTRLIIDNNGLPSSELKELSTIEYKYNKNRQLIQKTEKDKTGQLLQQINQTYSDGKLIKMVRLSGDGSTREIRDFKYSETGNLILEKCGSRLIKYEYDDKKNKIKEFRYYGKIPELALFYTYDLNGKVSEIKTVNEKGKQIRLEQLKWERDLLSAYFCLNEKNVVLSDNEFEYSCFHDGNWLKRIRFSIKDINNKVPIDVIYRSITYSDNYPEVKPIHNENLEILKEEKKSLSFSDGSSYRGNLVDGKMEGHGFIQWNDGSSYKGNFKFNRMDGEGILTWPNGDIYSGTFTNGKMEGIGRLRWKTGKTFYGLFENNNRTNQGIIEED